MDPALKTHKKKGAEKNSISFTQLTSLNKGNEKCYLIWGCVFSFIAGLGMPFTFVIFGDSMESLGSPTVSPEENFDLMVTLCTYMFIIGFLTWLFAFLYQATLAIFAEKTSRNIKVAYLQAIFRQDASWFDNTNYTELASNVSRQASAIQKGTGEKIGTLVMAFG
jgi:ATP-binding cassette subfamily B (MDR/TAP) protein 1